MPDIPFKAVPVDRLTALTRQYAAQSVEGLTAEEVLQSLREDGITDLETLIEKSVAGLGPGTIGKESFIYEQFIYRKEMPIPDELLSQIARGLHR